jgi:Rrf2 family protein
LSDLKKTVKFVTLKYQIMLTKTCEYALRAMIYIAQQSGNRTVVNIKEISENINSPQLFITKILNGLSKKGFLHSSKGRYGGYALSEEHAKISLADIVTAIDGDKMFSGCGLGLAFCSETNPCPIHHEYKDARDRLKDIYGKTTLDQFRNQDQGEKLLLRRQ